MSETAQTREAAEADFARLEGLGALSSEDRSRWATAVSVRGLAHAWSGGTEKSIEVLSALVPQTERWLREAPGDAVLLAARASASINDWACCSSIWAHSSSKKRSCCEICV